MPNYNPTKVMKQLRYHKQWRSIEIRCLLLSGSQDSQVSSPQFFEWTTCTYRKTPIEIMNGWTNPVTIRKEFTK